MVTNKVAIIVVNAGYTSGDTVAEAKNYFEQILRYFDATNMNVQKYGKLAERFAVGLAEAFSLLVFLCGIIQKKRI